jgi:hypothetical protein
MAGGIAYGEEERLLLRPSLVQRFLPPRIPVNRVSRVLAKI